MEAGLSPDLFWKQTPRTFVTIMEAKARAANQRFERALSQAWHTAAFVGAAQAGKLKKWEHYLAASKPRRAQSGGEMLAALREMNTRGAPMTIRKVEG